MVAVGLAVAGFGAWWLLAGPGSAAGPATKAAGRAAPAAVLPPAATPLPTAAPTPVLTPADVEVDLFVDPPAEVSIDGKGLGRVQSSKVRLAIGRHTLKQTIPGYREETREVDVTAAGQQIALRLPPFGILSVVNDFNVPVQGAKVFLDGRNLGALPVRDRKVEAGAHELKVVWPDGSEWREAARIPAASAVTRVVRPQ